MQQVEAVRKRISDILVGALSGQDQRYRHQHDDGFAYTKWGLVEKDINEALDGLAAHPADDGDATTKERLADRFGFVPEGVAMILGPLTAFFYSPEYATWSYGGRSIKEQPTIGHVRRLLEAVGGDPSL